MEAQKTAERLEQYGKKRNLNKSGEPAPKGIRAKGTDLAYVVQHHFSRREHYDFRLEHDGVLLSWAVPKGPSKNPSDKRLAVMVEDHPIEYKDFEGTIPEGEYGAGMVEIWDRGHWKPYGDVDEALEKGVLKFWIDGQRLHGSWALVRMGKGQNRNGVDGENEDREVSTKDRNWLLIKEKSDRPEEESHGDTKSNKVNGKGNAHAKRVEKKEKPDKPENKKSAKGKRKIAESPKNPFTSVSPQLASSVSQMPLDRDWVFEVKHDGIRALAFVQDGKARLASRNGKELGKRFIPIVQALQGLGSSDGAQSHAFVLDGEIVVLDAKGRSDFGALQRSGELRENPSRYVVFDMLALDGVDLRDETLLVRKGKLAELLEGMESGADRIIYCNHASIDAQSALDAARELGLEGVIGKRPNGVYQEGRSREWIKLKCTASDEFAVCGFCVSEKRVGQISSLVLGKATDDGFAYAGRIGTGFSETERARLFGMLSKSVSKRRPFADFEGRAEKRNKGTKGEKIFWVKPKLVVEVTFAEMTAGGIVRHGVYKGIREDKAVEETGQIGMAGFVINSERDGDGGETGTRHPKGHEKAKATAKPISDLTASAKPRTSSKGDLVIQGVTISHPGKLMYENPPFSKGEVAAYYAKAAYRMLDYMGGRPLSVVRRPGGAGTDVFFKKHPDTTSGGVVPFTKTAEDGSEKEYFYIDSVNGIIQEVQNCTLEFHAQAAKALSLDAPDIMTFDLDPDEGMALDRVKEGVVDLKAILDELSLPCYLKTSGSKGYHILVAFEPKAGWDAFSGMAKNIALLMQAKHPEKYTANMRKDMRRGKIFVDWMRNTRGATSVAPYSLRARDKLSVSLPISFSDLDSSSPNGYGFEDALTTLAGKDPWKGFFDNPPQLVQ